VCFSSPGPNGEVMIQLKQGAREVEFIVYEGTSKYVTFEDDEFNKQGELSPHLLHGIIDWMNL
ncbi:MAG: hypothetical protein AAGI38_13940, partial [Bacteroidota bacterium]